MTSHSWHLASSKRATSLSIVLSLLAVNVRPCIAPGLQYLACAAFPAACATISGGDGTEGQQQSPQTIIVQPSLAQPAPAQQIIVQPPQQQTLVVPQNTMPVMQPQAFPQAPIAQPQVFPQAPMTQPQVFPQVFPQAPMTQPQVFPQQVPRLQQAQQVQNPFGVPGGGFPSAYSAAMAAAIQQPQSFQQQQMQYQIPPTNPVAVGLHTAAHYQNGRYAYPCAPNVYPTCCTYPRCCTQCGYGK